MGLRDRLKRIQKAVEGETVTLKLRVGTTARFSEAALGRELFLHEWDRGKRRFEGEEPGPAHPFVEALRNAAPGEVERLVPTQGTMILHFLGEDGIMRGETTPGPIAMKLRALREERGLTQNQAAGLADVTPQTLIDLESGKRPPTCLP